MSRVIPDPRTVPTITVAQAAEILGVGVRTVYDQVERGTLPAIRLARIIRIPTGKFLAKFDLEPTAAEPEPLPAA